MPRHFKSITERQNSSKTDSCNIHWRLCWRLSAMVPALLASVSLQALPIPQAATESLFASTLEFSDTQVIYTRSTSVEALSSSFSYATATDSAGIPSGHFARAEASAHLPDARGPRGSNPAEDTSNSLRANLSSHTFAKAWWNGPLFSSATTDNQALITDLDLTLTPDSALTVAWGIDTFELKSAPSAAHASMIHMESITLNNTAENNYQPITFSYGFKASSIDGKSSWTAFDFPGSTVISDFLGEALGTGQGRSSHQLYRELGTLRLADVIPQALHDNADLSLSYSVSHREFSSEAPLAPVLPVGERIGMANTTGSARWLASERQLAFDPWRLDEATDVTGRPLQRETEESSPQDFYLELDPIDYVGEIGSGYFVGTGKLRLLSADATVLLEALIPGLVFDTRLSDQTAFNLFAPLLDVKVNQQINSAWLTEFTHRLASVESQLPQLFIEIDPPTHDQWARDFVRPARAILSFAGPAIPVNIGSSLHLLLLGLIVGLTSKRLQHTSRG